MSKYTYNLDFYIRTELTSVFEENFKKVLDAHRHNTKEKALDMSLSRTFLGGEDVMTLSIAMDSLDEIDSWGHTPALVLEVYGQEEGLKILDNYCKATRRWESRVTTPVEW